MSRLPFAFAQNLLYEITTLLPTMSGAFAGIGGIFLGNVEMNEAIAQQLLQSQKGDFINTYIPHLEDCFGFEQQVGESFNLAADRLGYFVEQWIALADEFDNHSFSYPDVVANAFTYLNIGTNNQYDVLNRGYTAGYEAYIASFVEVEQLPNGVVPPPDEGEAEYVGHWAERVHDIHSQLVAFLQQQEEDARRIYPPTDYQPNWSNVLRINHQFYSLGNPYGYGIVDDAITTFETNEKQAMIDDINATYPDPTTRKLLTDMLASPTGRQTVEFLLYMGKKYGPNFIRYEDKGRDGGQAQSHQTYIVLNTYGIQNFYQDPDNQFEARKSLVHESIEIYFENTGLDKNNPNEDVGPMATQHGDYVAEWFEGKYGAESGGDIGYYGSTFQTFHQDQIPSDGVYHNEPVGPGPVTGYDPGDIPNPWGLDPGMLTCGDMNIYDPVAAQILNHLTS